MNPTRAEIDLGKLAFNLQQIRKHIHKQVPNRKVRICGVVKANAYGHGIERISRELTDLGADCLGVANYDEAIRLRKVIPEAPILVFGTLIHSKLLPEKYVSLLLRYQLTATVASLDTAKFLNEYSSYMNRRFTVHIEVDTGMRRIGIDFKHAYKTILQICSMKNLNVEGIFSHFATSETKTKAFAKHQLERFKELLHNLKKAGAEFPLIHCANSGAIWSDPDFCFTVIILRMRLKTKLM
jgi:alanine racemase